MPRAKNKVSPAAHTNANGGVGAGTIQAGITTGATVSPETLRTARENLVEERARIDGAITDIDSALKPKTMRAGG